MVIYGSRSTDLLVVVKVLLGPEGDVGISGIGCRLLLGKKRQVN